MRVLLRIYFLDTYAAGNLIATDIVAAANHDDYLDASFNDRLDLFGNPAGTFVVKPLSNFPEAVRLIV